MTRNKQTITTLVLDKKITFETGWDLGPFTSVLVWGHTSFANCKEMIWA